MFAHSDLLESPTDGDVKAGWVVRGQLEKMKVGLMRVTSTGVPGAPLLTSPLKITVLPYCSWRVEAAGGISHNLEVGNTDRNSVQGVLNFKRPVGFWMKFELHTFAVQGWPAPVFVVRPVNFKGRVAMKREWGSDWCNIDLVCPPPGLPISVALKGVHPREFSAHHIGDILDLVLACGEVDREYVRGCTLASAMTASHHLVHGDWSARTWNKILGRKMLVARRTLNPPQPTPMVNQPLEEPAASPSASANPQNQSSTKPTNPPHSQRV